MKLLFGLVPVGAAALLLAGQGAPPVSPPTSPPPTLPAPEPPKPDEGLRPVSYFTAHCQRCHGPGGNRYGDLSGRTDDQLKSSIHDMAEGPGEAPLSEAGLRLQLCLHRAIRAKEPFVAVVSVKDGKVEGETTPDAAVTFFSKNKAIKVENKEGTFAFQTKDPKAMVAARVGNKVATIPASRVGTSHGR